MAFNDDDNLSQYLYVLEIPSHLTSNECDSVIELNLTLNTSDTSYTNILLAIVLNGMENGMIVREHIIQILFQIIIIH